MDQTEITSATSRVDIGVGGRFHADRMAAAFAAQGFDVHVWTSLPASRFPESRARIHSRRRAEIIFRALRRIGRETRGDILKMKTLGNFMARRIARLSIPPDLFVGWSSFSLEVFTKLPHLKKALVRDSIHIQDQMEILRAAYSKAGIAFANRNPVVERELAEYRLADTIFVLSEFAKKSFVDRGTPASKIEVLRLGVDTSVFDASPESHTVTAPLKVVYFGTVSVRKGIPDLLEATRNFPPTVLELTIVGDIEPGMRRVLERYSHANFKPAMRQSELAVTLRTQNIFVLPTLEDGFGQTLIQAMACGCIPITTNRCGAGECLTDGKNGFIFEAGDSRGLTEVLMRLTESEFDLPLLRANAIATARGLGWDSYASQIKRWTEKEVFGIDNQKIFGK